MNVKMVEIFRKIWNIITAPYHWCRKMVCGIIASFRSKSMYYRLLPELNRIGTRHIDRVTGPHGVLNQEFRRRLKQFKPDGNPIGEEETRSLIDSLLKLALAEREALSGQIVKSAEIGAMYNSYYGKLQRINELEVEAGRREKARDAAFDEYEFIRQTYMEIRRNTYVVSVEDDDGKVQTGGGVK